GAGVYGDFVCMVDHAVGRVQEALKQAGLAENTIVIFTSDNGAHWLPEDIAATQHQANAHFSGMKSDVWEGGHHVPFIVTWPHGIKNGKTSDEVICTTDLMATCAEMIGVPLSENSGEDSFSFWKVLTGESHTAPLREATIHHSISGEFALRQGDWVYIDCKGSGGWSKREGADTQQPQVQLYNVVEDPQEMNNLCEQYPEKVAAMKALLEKYKSEGRSRSL
ncbi:MAG: sulfatase-like hydrolase/transferase, partial [Tannerellaceae bacterium]